MVIEIMFMGRRGLFLRVFMSWMDIRGNHSVELETSPSSTD